MLTPPGTCYSCPSQNVEAEVAGRIRQISRYLQAYLNGGALNGVTILQKATLSEMWREQLLHESRVQGLTWYAQKSGEHELYWGHGGSDPGINTDVRCSQQVQGRGQDGLPEPHG